MVGRLSPGMQREFTTLCHCGDLMLQGRLAETLDAIVQRLKSLEMLAQGSTWQLAQKIEVVPAAEASMSSRQELQIARKESRLDQDARGSLPPNSEKGKGKSKEKGAKGKEKGKGKQKDSDSKKNV